MDLTIDSGEGFLAKLDEVAAEDAAGLKKAYESYGDSWKRRGGVGAFMMLARKWDRLENRVRNPMVVTGDPNVTHIDSYDLFTHIAVDGRAEGIIDDVRDLRRYLLLVEAEMRARGFRAGHRDNAAAPVDRAREMNPHQRRGGFTDRVGHSVVPGDRVRSCIDETIYGDLVEALQDGDAEVQLLDGTMVTVKWNNLIKA